MSNNRRKDAIDAIDSAWGRIEGTDGVAYVTLWTAI